MRYLGVISLGLLGGILGMAVGVWLLLSLTPTAQKPWPTPRKYLAYMREKEEPQVLLGNEIRTNGNCVEVLLNGRVDTIICGMEFAVTEESSTTGQPDRFPAVQPMQ